MRKITPEDKAQQDKDFEAFKKVFGQYHIKLGRHVFVLKSVKVLDVGFDGQYGDPYTSACDFDIINGEAHVTSMLGKFTRNCFKTLTQFAGILGIKKGNYLRKKKGKDNFKNVNIDE